jgi:hypothetical protein
MNYALIVNSPFYRFLVFVPHPTVNALLFKELAVFTLLGDFAVFEHENFVTINDCRESVGYFDNGFAFGNFVESL